MRQQQVAYYILTSTELAARCTLPASSHELDPGSCGDTCAVQESTLQELADNHSMHKSMHRGPRGTNEPRTFQSLAITTVLARGFKHSEPGPTNDQCPSLSCCIDRLITELRQ